MNEFISFDSDGQRSCSEGKIHRFDFDREYPANRGGEPMDKVSHFPFDSSVTAD